MVIKRIICLLIISEVAFFSNISMAVSQRTQEFLQRSWGTSSFDEGIIIFTDKHENLDSRQMALGRLYSKRRQIGQKARKQLLSKTLSLAKDINESPRLSAQSIKVAATLMSLMKEEKQITFEETAQEVEYFMTIAEDVNRPLVIRNAAIKALGYVDAHEAIPLLEKLIDDPENINIAELSRPACLALVQMKGSSSFENIRKVFQNTQDMFVFNTCAYCLSQIKTEDSMVTLNRQRNRFSDSGVVDLVLSNMENIILDILNDSSHPYLLDAIEATHYLWQPESREKYLLLLQNLFIRSSKTIKIAILEQLFVLANNISFEIGNHELEKILPLIENEPDLREYVNKIKKRVSSIYRFANLDESEIINQPINTTSVGCGNTDSQEYGDAVYRYLKWSSVPLLYNYNHAGIYAGTNSSDSKRVIEAPGLWQNVKEVSFYTSYQNLGANYYGAYTLSNKTLSFIERKQIVGLALLLEAADIGYTFDDALDYKWYSFDGTIEDIRNIRCDGLVEYCYERSQTLYGQTKPSHKVWWDSKASHNAVNEWNIAKDPDVKWHNNMPGTTVNPDYELSPWAQRGAPPNTGPSFDQANNPNNTYLNQSSEVNPPDIQATQSQASGLTQIYLSATDVSGIHYIKFKIGDSAWQYSDIGDQHPVSDTLLCTIDITESNYLYFKSMDNGGNETATFYFWVDVIPDAPPISPILNSPSDDSIVSGSDIDFTWYASSGASNYHFQMDIDPGFGVPFIDIDIGNTTILEITGFPNDGTRYYWRVKAWNAAGWSGYSQAWSFVNIPADTPDPPILESPSNDSIVSGSDIDFTWYASPGASNYHFQLDTDSGFGSPIVDNDIGNTTILGFTGFPNNGTRYYWRVKAWNAAGWGEYSQTWSFVNIPTDTPDPPILESPSNDSIVSGSDIDFTWYASPEASNYHFQMDIDSGFGAPFIDNDIGNTTVLEVTGFPDDGTRFYWRVKAWNVLGWSEYSNVWYFDNGVAPPPLPAVNQDPQDGFTNISVSTQLNWSDGGGAISYDVYFGTNPSPSSNEYKGEQTDNSYNPGILSYNTVYYWRIDAKNSVGTTTGSIWSFTTESEPAPPQEFFDNFETGDFNLQPWQHGGNASWIITSDNPYKGNYAARSGIIADNQISSIELTKNVPSGYITFSRKVSSEYGYDWLTFYIDGILAGLWTGEEDWQKKRYFVEEGTHNFKWIYQKDFIISYNSDCGWIDEIKFEAEALDNDLIGWVDFHYVIPNTSNLEIIPNSYFAYDGDYEDHWLIYGSGGGFTITFNSLVAQELELIVRHLSSASQGCPGGGYSPITIMLNGIAVVSNYDPALNHGGTHGFTTDIWPIQVMAGINNIEWIANDLCTNYWVQGIEIRYPNDLQEDFNGDLSVAQEDLSEFVENWLKLCDTPNWCGRKDLNKDGLVNLVDFSRIAKKWLWEP